MKADRLDVARALREIGALLQLTGENPYKARAYETGAAAVEGMGGDLGARVAGRSLTEVPGIGKALAAQIGELAATGSSSLLESLRAKVPPGSVALMDVPSMTLKRIRALHDALGIDSVESLRKACEEGRVRGVRGFGAKTEAAILEGVRAYDRHDERVLLVDAITIAEHAALHMRACPAVERAEIVGSVRRWTEAVGDVDVLAITRDPDAAVAHFVRLPSVARVESRSAEGAALRIGGGVKVDLHVAPPARAGSAMVRFTGSASHVARLEAIAASRGLTLAEIPGRTEEDVYRALGLAPVPPELREDEGEIEASGNGTLASDLLTVADIQGMVHCHTAFSDGRNTVLEMAREAEAMGMKYITITDHSPAAHYAGGVDLERLKVQWAEIDEAQEHVTVKILRGTESDILADGSLDYPDRVLERFDVIIASIHGRMKMDEDQMTARIRRAMELPVFKIWGHALGRLVLRRPPVACRVEEILDVIAGARAAIEINGDPYRLDMAPPWLREARKRDLRFVVSVDAHSTRGMRVLPFGVAMARRAGVRRGEVLNALPASAFARAVRPAA